jgi:uncharacterized repeat protein (TIGR01451 family)
MRKLIILAFVLLSAVLCLVGSRVAVGASSGTAKPGLHHLLINPALVDQAGVTVQSYPAGSVLALSVRNQLGTEADLQVSVSDTPDPVTASTSDTLTYQFTITNLGPSDAVGVTAMATLPTGVSFTSSVPTSPDCIYSNGVVTCNLGNIVAGANRVVTIITQVTTTGGTLLLTASASSSTEDPSSSNNSEGESTTVDRIRPNWPTLPVWIHPVSDGERYNVYGETVALQLAYPTDNVGVAGVNFYRWDAENLVFIDIGTVTSAPYQVLIDTDVLNHGWNQVFGRAYDAVGNFSQALPRDERFIWLYFYVQIFLPGLFR